MAGKVFFPKRTAVLYISGLDERETEFRAEAPLQMYARGSTRTSHEAQHRWGAGMSWALKTDTVCTEYR